MKKGHELIEIVPAGPTAKRDAEVVRVRFVHEITERKNPKTNATVTQLLEKYLAQFQGSPNTAALRDAGEEPHQAADRRREDRSVNRLRAGRQGESGRAFLRAYRSSLLRA